MLPSIKHLTTGSNLDQPLFGVNSLAKDEEEEKGVWEKQEGRAYEKMLPSLVEVCGARENGLSGVGVSNGGRVQPSYPPQNNTTKLAPMFEMQLVLFPYESMKLHVYEPRFRQLIAYYKEFGIIQEYSKEPEGYDCYITPDGTKLSYVGTLARVDQVTALHEDGSFDIIVTGFVRFSINTQYQPWRNNYHLLYLPIDIIQESIPIHDLIDTFNPFNSTPSQNHSAPLPDSTLDDTSKPLKKRKIHQTNSSSSFSATSISSSSSSTTKNNSPVNVVESYLPELKTTNVYELLVKIEELIWKQMDLDQDSFSEAIFCENFQILRRIIKGQDLRLISSLECLKLIYYAGYDYSGRRSRRTIGNVEARRRERLDWWRACENVEETSFVLCSLVGGEDYRGVKQELLEVRNLLKRLRKVWDVLEKESKYYAHVERRNKLVQQNKKRKMK